MKRYAAEGIGTFALVFAGTGAITINDVSGGAITHAGIALTFGPVVMAIVEMHAFEIPRHTRTHLDAVDRDEAADILVVVDNVALDRDRHRHRRRWRGRRSALAVAAGGERRGQNQG